MNWNKWIRQTHRWVSIAFVLVVAGIFATLGLGQQPAQWVYLLPLLPLCKRIIGAAMCVSWKTRCTVRCCWRRVI